MGGPVQNLDQAQALAQSALDLLYLGDDVVIDDQATIEHDHGWTFFYNPKAYLESGAVGDRLCGDAPFVVDRETGRVVQGGTSQRWEDLVVMMREYDR